MRIKTMVLTMLTVLTIMLFGSADVVHARKTTWVNDETNQLTNDTHNSIATVNEKSLAQHELRPQVMFEVLSELPKDYADIDEYKNKRFNDIGVGEEGLDSGILFVILLDDRDFGIEVGYGAEHIVTDLESAYILRNIEPLMKEYSDTGTATYINEAMVQVATDISRMFNADENGQTEELRTLMQDNRVTDNVENEVVIPPWMYIAFIIFVIVDMIFFDGTFTYLLFLLFGGGSGSSSSSGSSRRSGGGRSGGGGSSGSW